jgi:aryl-alcohol dehydrogenase-like predicted oxidoreductase
MQRGGKIIRLTCFLDPGLSASPTAHESRSSGEGGLVCNLFNKADQHQANLFVRPCLDPVASCSDRSDVYSTGKAEIIPGKALNGKRQASLIMVKYGLRTRELIR